MIKLANKCRKFLKALNIPEFLGRKKSQELPAKNDVMSSGRESITRLFIKGEGIEIGALHNPLLVPEDVKVRYK